MTRPFEDHASSYMQRPKPMISKQTSSKDISRVISDDLCLNKIMLIEISSKNTFSLIMQTTSNDDNEMGSNPCGANLLSIQTAKVLSVPFINL